MTDTARPMLLATGAIMPSVVERQLSPRFDILALDQLDAPRAPAVTGILTKGAGRVDDALMTRLPNLQIIANFGVGYDQVDTAAAARRGLVVTHTPDVLNEEVADLALGLLLATVREIPKADRFVREGGWLKGALPLTATLRGRKVGIVGMGRIGRAIATRVQAFGLDVAYHTRRPQPDLAYRHYPDLLAMARDMDTLMVIVPGGAATRHMINAEVLEVLGPEGVVVNVARGSVVDEDALIAALRSGTILAAGLDVFESEPQVPQALIAMDNVVLLPHVGSATHHTRNAMGQLVVDNLLSWYNGNGPLTPVPETPWPRT